MSEYNCFRLLASAHDGALIPVAGGPMPYNQVEQRLRAGDRRPTFTASGTIAAMTINGGSTLLVFPERRVR